MAQQALLAMFNSDYCQSKLRTKVTCWSVDRTRSGTEHTAVIDTEKQPASLQITKEAPMAGGTGNSWSSLGWKPGYYSRGVRRPEDGSGPNDTTAKLSAVERRTQSGERAGWQAEASRRRIVQHRAIVCCCSKRVPLSFACLWG